MACRVADIMQANSYYLRCRDVDGTSVIITPTATGLGAHTRWIYPEHEDEENTMDVDEEEETVEDRLSTPPPTTVKYMPETPMAQHTFNAGSVICTPVKKLRPLQRSPERIGFNGIDFWHDDMLGNHTIEQTSSGPCLRYVVQRPIGCATNLSKEQMSEQQFQRNHAIFLTQVEKLLGREGREKVMREMNTTIEEETEKHLGSVTFEGKEWQVYKTLRPRKDGQPRIIPAQPNHRKARKSAV